MKLDPRCLFHNVFVFSPHSQVWQTQAMVSESQINIFAHSQSNKVSSRQNTILVITTQFINFQYVCTGVTDGSLANSFADDSTREIKARSPSLC